MANVVDSHEVLLNPAAAAYWLKLQGERSPAPSQPEPQLRNPIIRLFALLADELPDDIATIDRDSNCLGLPVERVIPFNEETVKQMGQVCVGCEAETAMKCASFRQAYGVNEGLEEMIGLSDHDRRTVVGLIDGKQVEPLFLSASVIPTLVTAGSSA